MNTEEIYKEFGRLLCNARKGAGMTQQQVANRVGLSRTSITNIEKGRQHVSLHQIYLLADAIGTAPSELFPSKSSQEVPDSLSHFSDSVKKLLEDSEYENEHVNWVVRQVVSSKTAKEKDNG